MTDLREKVARAIYHSTVVHYEFERPHWADLCDEDKRLCFEQADAALAVIGPGGVREANLRETFEAMVAMRNEINEYVPLPSLESDLLQGPENSVFCATLAKEVIRYIEELKCQISTEPATGVTTNGPHGSAANAPVAVGSNEPSPASVQNAARVLLDLLEAKPENAPINISTIEDVWKATFKETGFLAVRGFLRAPAEGSG